MAAPQAACGLAHISNKGFAHRDVACRNIFCAATLDAKGGLQRHADGGVVGLRVVIADFGRVRSAASKAMCLPPLLGVLKKSNASLAERVAAYVSATDAPRERSDTPCTERWSLKHQRGLAVR